MTAITTSRKVFEFLRLNTRVPSHTDMVNGNTFEVVDNSGILTANSVVYLDNNRVINDTVNLYSGTSITATKTNLIKDTDYTIDLDMGEIILLSPGASKLTSKSLFARYQYNTLISDSIVDNMIDNQTDWIHDVTNQTFGTTYLVEKEEYQGKGEYSRVYRVKNLPLNHYKSQLISSIGTAVTTIPVDSTSGLIVGDIVSLGKEKLRVTAVLSSTAFMATRGYDITSAIAIHLQDDWLTNVVVEISNQDEGYSPDWVQLEFRSNFDADSNTGAIQLLHVDSEDYNYPYRDVFPPNHIFNRLRISYRYGNPNIPPDIEDLGTKAVARELVDMAMFRALSDGANSFNPQVIDNLDRQIDKILREHKLLLTDGD